MIKFFIRCIMLLTLVVLFIPAGEYEQKAEHSFTFGTAFLAATHMMDDVQSVCDRKPVFCDTIAAGSDIMKAKARNGVRMLAEFIELEDK